MDTESKPKDSLLSALDANISQYILILREITRILRTAGENNNDGNDSMTKISPSDQIAMENDVKTVEAKVLHHLDPLFTKDKDLQKILKAISERDALAAQIRDQKHTVNILNTQILALQNEYVKHIDLSKERINLIQKQLRVLEAIRERKLSGLLKSNDYNNLLDVEMLLALGSRVALSAGPPSGWTEKSPLYAHRPPFPTEDIMRCSSLFRFMNTPNQEAPLQHTIEVNEMQTSVGLGKSSPQKRTEKKKTKDSEESDNEMLMLDLNPDMI